MDIGVRFFGRFSVVTSSYRKIISQDTYCASLLQNSIDFYTGHEYSMRRSNDEYVNYYIEFNSNQNGWHYGWQSSKHTNDVKHVFEIMVLIPTSQYESKNDTTRCIKDYENLKLIKSFPSPEFNIVCSKRKKTVEMLGVNNINLLFEKKRSCEESELMHSIQQPSKLMVPSPIHQFYSSCGDVVPPSVTSHLPLVDENSLLQLFVAGQTSSMYASSIAGLDTDDDGSFQTAVTIETPTLPLPPTRYHIEHNSKSIVEKNYASNIDILLKAMELMQERACSESTGAIGAIASNSCTVAINSSTNNST